MANGWVRTRLQCRRLFEDFAIPAAIPSIRYTNLANICISFLCAESDLKGVDGRCIMGYCMKVMPKVYKHLTSAEPSKLGGGRPCRATSHLYTESLEPSLTAAMKLAMIHNSQRSTAHTPKLLGSRLIKVWVVEQKVGGELFVLVAQHVRPQHRLSVEAQGLQLIQKTSQFRRIKLGRREESDSPF